MMQRKQSRLCLRCTKLDVLELIQSNQLYSWWYEDNKDGRHNPRNLIDSVAYRELGKLSGIKFFNGCALCPLLGALLGKHAFAPQDDLFLLPAWGIERIEQSISLWWMQYKQRHQSWARSHPEAVRYSIVRPKAHKTEEVTTKNIKYSKILYIASKSNQQSRTGVWRTFTFPHEALNALGIVENDHDSPVMGGRTIRDEIDFGIIAGWISQCELHHGLSCKPWSTNVLKSISLIDVHARATVPYKTGVEYLCLSYVWGNIVQGTHRLGETLGQLPATLEDAITVVKALGKRYLWVDSVCTVASRKDCWLIQISDLR